MDVQRWSHFQKRWYLRCGKKFEATKNGMFQNPGGGFKYVLFSPLLGEIIQFHEYFSDGLKPPTRSFPGSAIGGAISVIYIFPLRIGGAI